MINPYPLIHNCGKKFNNEGRERKYFSNCHYCDISELATPLYAVGDDAVCNKCIKEIVLVQGHLERD
jgi:hypothetical protein